MKIRMFKDKHRGQRCFVVGNGPSLNRLDLSRLKEEITFCSNNLYTNPGLCFRPSYYAVEDRLIMQNFWKEINSFDVGMKFFPLGLRKVEKKSNVVFVNFVRGFVPIKFSTNSAKCIYWGSTVTYLLLQLAYYMGCNPVYLIGMDCTEDHFVPNEDYYRSKKHYSAKWDLVFQGYEKAKVVFEADGRVIVNATVGGGLKLFGRQDYSSLFGG